MRAFPRSQVVGTTTDTAFFGLAHVLALSAYFLIVAPLHEILPPFATVGAVVFYITFLEIGLRSTPYFLAPELVNLRFVGGGVVGGDGGKLDGRFLGGECGIK